MEIRWLDNNNNTINTKHVEQIEIGTDPGYNITIWSPHLDIITDKTWNVNRIFLTKTHLYEKKAKTVTIDVKTQRKKNTYTLKYKS